ncbi:MAG: hypothetical protein KJP07_16135 [Desulfatitalea sp.]|nr:hypothetical protein [Desulfatitalea sp.]
MKKLMKELSSISKALLALAEKLEHVADTFEKEDVQVKPVKETAGKKKAAPKKKVTAKKAAKKVVPKEIAPKAAESTQASDNGSLLEIIHGLISAEGTTIAEIREKAGLAPRQVSNALYKLTQKGLIDTVSRGVYKKNNH